MNVLEITIRLHIWVLIAPLSSITETEPVLLPEVSSGPESLGTIALTCGTDNQGNMYLMDKLLTTKYPSGVVLMELATQLSRRRATLRANWIPRLQNEEADALTNWTSGTSTPLSGLRSSWRSWSSTC